MHSKELQDFREFGKNLKVKKQVDTLGTRRDLHGILT